MQLGIRNLLVIHVPHRYVPTLKLLMVQVIKSSMTGHVNIAIRRFTQVNEPLCAGAIDS
jgi:hypothetical protein